MTRPVPSLVLHLHLYQPPREDPWWGLVQEEANAAPDHDWNRRIDRECYAPLTAARVTDRAGRILEVENLLEWTSFDVGPTLLRWLEAESPETYRAILLAEARSRARQGFGNAVAAPYHHVILPFASQADKRTEVRWGIRDFERRFGSTPTGMWVPETAVDTATLEVLAEEGIRFTILAPHQVDPLPEGGVPGRIRLSRGREIIVFPYDGGLSHDVAFGALISDGEAWIRRLEEAAGREGTALISMATDAETFGHHHAFGEMALASVIRHFRDGATLRLEGWAACLSRGGSLEDVSLVEETSWSCVHGIERWRSDCGCGAAPENETQQAWRAPIREVVDLVQTMAHEAYVEEAGAVFEDPFGVRDDFGAVLDVGVEERRAFVARYARVDVAPEAEARALELLEMERNALAAATSCGWFFDDFAGLEGTQVLGYLVRTLELLQGSWPPSLPPAVAAGLEVAESNDPKVGNALEQIERHFLSRTPAAVAVGAGARLSSRLIARSTEESEGHLRLGPWMIGNVQGSMLTMVDERTGQSWTLGPWEELEPWDDRRPGGGDWARRLGSADRALRGVAGTGESLSLARLPGTFLGALLMRAREALLHSVLSPAERATRTDTEALELAAERVLLAALDSEGDSPPDPRRVEETLDAIGLLGIPVPYRAIGRLAECLDGSRMGEWTNVAQRMGFAGDRTA